MAGRKGLIALIAWSLLAAACAGPKPTVVTVLDGYTQGGTYKITLKSDRNRSDLQAPVDALLAEIEGSMSLYDPQSLLNRLNRNETDSLDRYITRCIEVAREISRESDGAYDITVKPLFEAWGFLGRETGRIPNVDSLLQYVGHDKIAVRDGRLVKSSPGVQIDLNSIAQGMTADVVAQFLEGQRIREYLIEVGGGEIFCRGTNPKGLPWRVGIDRPAEGNMIPGADLQAVVELSDKGLATSGNYRKFRTDADGNRVVHTLDPKTGYGVQNDLLSATVIAPNATLADAYATMFMVLGAARSIEFLETKPDLMVYFVIGAGGKNGIRDDNQRNDRAFQTYISPPLRAHLIRE